MVHNRRHREATHFPAKPEGPCEEVDLVTNDVLVDFVGIAVAANGKIGVCAGFE